METKIKYTYYDKNCRQIRSRMICSDDDKVLIYDHFTKKGLEYTIYYHENRWETKHTFDENKNTVKIETYKVEIDKIL